MKMLRNCHIPIFNLKEALGGPLYASYTMCPILKSEMGGSIHPVTLTTIIEKEEREVVSGT